MPTLAELSKGKREYLATTWPANPGLGREQPMPMKLQALSDEEFQECVAAAYERFRKLKLDVNTYTADDLESEISIQILARACRDPEQPDKISFAVDADDLRRNTAPWERQEVGRVWEAFQDRRNPLKGITDAERQAIQEAVKKKDAATLKAFAPDTLVNFLLTGESPQSTAPDTN